MLGVGGARAVGCQRGVEQSQVAGVGEQAGVQHGVVAEGAVGPHPDELGGRQRAGAVERAGGHVPDVQSLHAVGPGPVRMLGLHSLSSRQQGLGIGHLGHRLEMLEAVLGDVERRRELEDGPAVLDGDHATGRERPPVSDAVHVVQHRCLGVAGPQEVGVHGVHRASLHRAGRGHQRLAGHLASEDALAIVVGRAAPEDVDLDGLQVEQGHHVVERGLH